MEKTMKILKAFGMALMLIFASCSSTQVINPGNVSSDELSVLKASDYSICIDAVDGTKLPVNTHSVTVAPGEHEVTFSYHNVGGTNSIVALMNISATFINQPTTQKVTILPKRKYGIRYSINVISNEVKYTLVPEPSSKEDYLVNSSMYHMKEVKRPEGYKPSLDIYDELPTEKNFEILGFVKYTSNTHGSRIKKVTTEEMVYLLEEAMKANNVTFDAIGYKTMQTGASPMWHVTIEALALKYTN